MRYTQMKLKTFTSDKHVQFNHHTLPTDISLSGAIALATELYGETESSFYWLIEDDYGNILASNIGTQPHAGQTETHT